MKELLIEEKAHRYDEAIKRLEDIKTGKCPKTFIFTKGLFDYIFPELKESEDEMVRACIGMCLTDIDEQRFADFNTNLKECRDWLKKQGEPNPYSGVSFKCSGHTWGMCARDNGVEILVDGEIKERVFLGSKPQGKSALEAINEEKVDNANKVEPRQEKLTEFERAVKQVMEEAIECGDTRNLKADADMLLSLVHKSSWSEEDEKFLSDIIKDLVNPWNEYIPDRIEDEIKWLKNKLKSLRPQSTWKPSGEQIKVLKEVKNIVGRKYKSYLNSLYSDLNKLRKK